jgi:hypothetical protein
MGTEAFEQKVWRRLDGQFGWKVRVAGEGGSFASGRERTRRDAEDAVHEAIGRREVERRAPWKKVAS